MMKSGSLSNSGMVIHKRSDKRHLLTLKKWNADLNSISSGKTNNAPIEITFRKTHFSDRTESAKSCSKVTEKAFSL